MSRIPWVMRHFGYETNHPLVGEFPKRRGNPNPKGSFHAVALRFDTLGIVTSAGGRCQKRVNHMISRCVLERT